MKILLVAYEFPPILAAQALRWFYLSNELAKLGVNVHVICPDISAEHAFPMDLDGRIAIHRVWPGPFIGLSQRLASKRHGRPEDVTGIKSSHASWAFRAYRLVRSVLDAVLYPDVRSEWYPFALRKMRKLLRTEDFDVVISSHEPAVDIFVGCHARRFNIPWVVDLGDPLLTPYSPRWRRAVDSIVERKVISCATSIWVTGDSVSNLLKQRHGEGIGEKISVLPQGFPSEQTDFIDRPSGRRFLLVFTGNFYRDFRNPVELAKALSLMKDLDISFIIAGNNSAFEDLFHDVDGVKFLGQRSHFECLELQQQADVLVNIGNVQSYQIPGKVYEYLGSKKPILHIQTGECSDPGAELIESTGAGVVVKNSHQEIERVLRHMCLQWMNDPGKLMECRKESLIQDHSWSRRAVECKRLLQKIL
ncbi:glycosyltransferase [Delftia lacustris]|uniref:glycosyltransferase n=1 Tax=Delftia lacustris TaxID=558537 RepID=UPI00285B23CB|nr:glycosyltransferase [Delftia lacustris]MDR6732605.1 hypothetical protein [Delftia lacustris]